MTSARRKIRPIRFLAASIALSVALVGAVFERLPAQDRKPSGATHASRRMTDGKRWMTNNLNVKTVSSYCYGDADKNCIQYGRLYTWESARTACQSLSDGWRLPTDGEWRQLATHYGGVSADSQDKGKAAYKALMVGGTSGFDAVLGGGRTPDGQYARGDAHGFYWTASESDPASALFYNFGKGGLALHRQADGRRRERFPFGASKSNAVRHSAKLIGQ
jgi:uncharacterized protein (TIGR02145 family)